MRTHVKGSASFSGEPVFDKIISKQKEDLKINYTIERLIDVAGSLKLENKELRKVFDCENI